MPAAMPPGRANGFYVGAVSDGECRLFLYHEVEYDNSPGQSTLSLESGITTLSSPGVYPHGSHEAEATSEVDWWDRTRLIGTTVGPSI